MESKNITHDTKPFLSFVADRQTVKKSARNSIIINVFFKLKGILLMPLITYYILPKDMGVFNLIYITASILTPLFTLNLTDGPAVYFVQEKSKERIRNMYNTVINSSLLSSLLCTVVFLILISIYSGNIYSYLPFLFLLLFSNIIFKIVSYILIVFQKTTIFLKNTFYKEIAATLILILLLIANFSYKGMIYAHIFANIVGAILIYQIIKKELPYRLFIDRKILSKFLKMSLPLFPVFFFSWVMHSSDSYFLFFYKGAIHVGKYAVVYRLSNIIMVLGWALNLFWFPVSAKLWIENKEKYKAFFIKMFGVFLVLSLIAVLLFELNSKIIMQLLVRRIEYHDSYVIMGLIAFSYAMQLLITLLTAPLYSNKNPRQIFISYFVGGISNCVLNFLLIPKTGIWGAAISTAISYVIVVTIMSYHNYNTAKFPFFDKRLFYIIPTFMIIWVGFFYIRDSIEFYQLILVNIALLLFSATMLYFRALNVQEREYLHLLCKKFKFKRIFKNKNG